MKKLLLLLLVFPLVFTSCSDDDDEKATEALVGTWSFAGSYGFVETNNETITDQILGWLDSEADEDDTMTFKKDGTVTMDGGTVSYKVKGNSIILIQKEGASTVEFTIPYTLKGKDLEMHLDQTKDYQEEFEDYQDIVITKVISIAKYTKE